MIHRTTAAITFAIFAFPTLGFAQSQVSEKDQEACTPDVFRLCQEFIPNEGPIVACLQAKRAQLSGACSLVMFPTPAPNTGDVTGTIARKHPAASHSHKKHAHSAKAANRG